MLPLLFGLIVVSVLVVATTAHATVRNHIEAGAGARRVIVAVAEQISVGPARHASRPAIWLALIRAILLPVVIMTAFCSFVATAAILYFRRSKRGA